MTQIQVSDRSTPAGAAPHMPAASGVDQAHEAPVIRPLGTLAELTLGGSPGPSDGFDGFGAS